MRNRIGNTDTAHRVRGRRGRQLLKGDDLPQKVPFFIGLDQLEVGLLELGAHKDLLHVGLKGFQKGRKGLVAWQTREQGNALLEFVEHVGLLSQEGLERSDLLPRLSVQGQDLFELVRQGQERVAITTRIHRKRRLERLENGIEARIQVEFPGDGVKPVRRRDLVAVFPKNGLGDSETRRRAVGMLHERKQFIVLANNHVPNALLGVLMKRGDQGRGANLRRVTTKNSLEG